jgi:uncharacterized membrane protein YqjE
VESLRALAGSFAALVRTRVELAVLELREEGERRKEMAVLAAIAGMFFMMGAILFAMLIVVIFWDTHRVAAAAGVTIVYLGIGAFALSRLRQRAREAPKPFEATLAELAQDVEALRGRHE